MKETIKKENKMKTIINYYLYNTDNLLIAVKVIGITLGIIGIIYLKQAYKKDNLVKINNIKNKIISTLILTLVISLSLNIVENSIATFTQSNKKVTKKNEIYLVDRLYSIKQNLKNLIGIEEFNNKSDIIGRKKLPPKINTFKIH